LYLCWDNKKEEEGRGGGGGGGEEIKSRYLPIMNSKGIVVGRHFSYLHNKI